MTWTKLLNEKRVTRERSGKAELDNLRSIVKRCLSDLNAQGVSDEQRFIIAYDAARTLSLMIVRACGYRPKRAGGHYNTFVALEAADPTFAQLATYFNVCRMKRNDPEYDFAGSISKDETKEIIDTVRNFIWTLKRGWRSCTSISLNFEFRITHVVRQQSSVILFSPASRAGTGEARGSY